MISLHNVTKKYDPDIQALKGVSFELKPGEFASLVGTSGSGKTTITRLLFAEERPTSGKVQIGEWDISQISPRDIPDLRRQMGIVFQDYKLLPQKTVFENVAFALEVAGVNNRQIKELVPSVLEIVGLSDKHLRFPRQLSGGEQQRVSIARALVHRPKILLADEPTGNLDAVTARGIVDLLLRINSFGTTVLMVTHDKDIVNSLKRRVVTLQNGEVISDQPHGVYHVR